MWPSLRFSSQAQAVSAIVHSFFNEPGDNSPVVSGLQLVQRETSVDFVDRTGRVLHSLPGALLDNSTFLRGRDLSKLPQKFLSALLRLSEAAAASEPVLLVGPTSCKSMIVKTFVELTSSNTHSDDSLVEVHLTSETESTDLIGQIRPVTPRDAAMLVVQTWLEAADRIMVLGKATKHDVRIESEILESCVERFKLQVKNLEATLESKFMEEDETNAATREASRLNEETDELSLVAPGSKKTRVRPASDAEVQPDGSDGIVIEENLQEGPDPWNYEQINARLATVEAGTSDSDSESDSDSSSTSSSSTSSSSTADDDGSSSSSGGS